ncbi:MAG: DnaJ domain-containing protein [Deltaproteobacteria bacterium]|nr:DnaJ domain-containing protein [Deltaproteobacteria bacterium]
MASEQANAFKKHRDADDAQGNLTWAARLQAKGVRASPEALARIDVEREFELSEDERVLWRLLKLPRKYMDIEHCGVLAVDKLRGALRGLVAADVVDIVDASDTKALIPAELRRLRAEVQGKEVQRPSQPLKARVYRPNIDGTPPEAPPTAASDSAPVAEVADAPRVPTAPRGVPRPVALRALTDEEQTLKAELERAHAAIAKQNHYDFLGLQRGCDDAAVRAAYVRLARDFHPDRVAGLGDPTLQSKVDELFKRLGDAQQAVASADARAQYDRALDSMGGATTTADGQRQRRPLEAQNAARIADVYFKKKELKSAEAHYRQAANFDPEDPKILTALAHCIWLNPDHEEAVRTAEARKRLQEVVNKHRFADAAYKLGLLLRKINDEGAAQRSFAQAHRLDPQHHEAEREVRLHEQRVHKQSKPDGLLGRFGKK